MHILVEIRAIKDFGRKTKEFKGLLFTSNWLMIGKEN